LLVYASSWIKLHYPGAFLAGLLRAQPMGFYSPATLTQDARHHGVEVRRPDIHHSGVEAGLEEAWVEERPAQPDASRNPGPTGMESCTRLHHPPAGDFDPDAPIRDAEHRRDG